MHCFSDLINNLAFQARSASVGIDGWWMDQSRNPYPHLFLLHRSRTRTHAQEEYLLSLFQIQITDSRAPATDQRLPDKLTDGLFR
jgi:hypothetical protein